MEIADFLSAAKRRLWVLIGVPLLAAGITTALVLMTPTQYAATTTINAPALVGGAPGIQYTGAQSVGQYAAAFQATAQGPTVRRAVEAATGLDPGRIGDGLTVTQVGASSVMTVTYEDTDRSVVQSVVTAVTKETLDELFATQVTLAKNEVAAAKKSLSDANAAIAAWEKKSGFVDPDRIYQSRVDAINSLTQQQASLRANGNAAGAAALDAAIATARAGLDKFGGILAEYNTLTATRDSAAASLTTAQQHLSGATVQQGAADPAKVTFTSGDHAVNSDSELLTKVVPVTGAALFAAVALVAIMEMLARSRATRGHRAHGTRGTRGLDALDGREPVPAGEAGRWRGVRRTRQAETVSVGKGDGEAHRG